MTRSALETMEPAAAMQRPTLARRRRRPRQWERDNPAFAYRIRPHLHDQIKQIAADLNSDPTFRTTISLVADAIIEAGLAQWEQGHLKVRGDEITPKSGRTRADLDPDAA